MGATTGCSTWIDPDGVTVTATVPSAEQFHRGAVETGTLWDRRSTSAAGPEARQNGRWARVAPSSPGVPVRSNTPGELFRPRLVNGARRLENPPNARAGQGEAGQAVTRDTDEDQPQSPHSAAWFAELTSINAELADLVADSLRRAGRRDACAVCGEWPALAVRRLGRTQAAEPATLRLCADCRLLRRVMYAEAYEAL